MSLLPQARCTLCPFPFLCSLTGPCTSPPFSPLWLASSSLPSHPFCVFTTSSPAAQTFSASYTNFAHSCWLHKIVLPISVHITASPSCRSHVVRCSSLSFASFILIPLCRYPLSLAHTASLTGWFISRHREFSHFSGYQQLTEIYHRSITDLSTENTVFPLGRGSACFSFPHSQAWGDNHYVPPFHPPLPILCPFSILMGLSHGITVHCGTSFTDERRTKSSQHPASPKIRKVKLNKSRRELQEAQWKHKERIASMYPLPLLVS